MAYPLYDGNGFIDMLTYTNTVTGGLAGPAILVMIWVIALVTIASSTGRFMAAVAVSSFMVTVMSLLLVPIGWIGAEFTIIAGVITIVSTLFSGGFKR